MRRARAGVFAQAETAASEINLSASERRERGCARQMVWPSHPGQNGGWVLAHPQEGVQKTSVISRGLLLLTGPSGLARDVLNQASVLTQGLTHRCQLVGNELDNGMQIPIAMAVTLSKRPPVSKRRSARPRQNLIWSEPFWVSPLQARHHNSPPPTATT